MTGSRPTEGESLKHRDEPLFSSPNPPIGSDEVREGIARIIDAYKFRPWTVDTANEMATEILALPPSPEVERLRVERDEARAALAYVLDHAVYGDSYGVHGSDFHACHFCTGGGAPGVALVHETTCPIARYPDAVDEWFEEMAAHDTDRQSAEAALAKAREGLDAAAPFLRIADEIVNATPDSDSYRVWLADSRDWMVIFGFAGQSITLGDLRKAALVARELLSTLPEVKDNG